MEDFVLFIRKPHILKADLQIVSVEIRFSFFQGGILNRDSIWSIL